VRAFIAVSQSKLDGRNSSLTDEDRARPPNDRLGAHEDIRALIAMAEKPVAADSWRHRAAPRRPDASVGAGPARGVALDVCLRKVVSLEEQRLVEGAGKGVREAIAEV